MTEEIFSDFEPSKEILWMLFQENKNEIDNQQKPIQENTNSYVQQENKNKQCILESQHSQLDFASENLKLDSNQAQTRSNSRMSNDNPSNDNENYPITTDPMAQTNENDNLKFQVKKKANILLSFLFFF